MTAIACTSAPQIKVIWTLGKKLGLAQEDIRAILFRETGKDSMKECTGKELDYVVLALRNLQKSESQPSNRATKKQVWKIHEIEKELGWQDNPKRLQAFLNKYYKIDQPAWLTSAQAWKAIESLKKVATKASAL